MTTIFQQLVMNASSDQPVDRSAWTDEDLLEVASRIRSYLKYDGRPDGDPNKRTIMLGKHMYQYVERFVVYEDEQEAIGYQDDVVMVMSDAEGRRTLLGCNWRNSADSRLHILKHDATDEQLLRVLFATNDAMRK